MLYFTQKGYRIIYQDSRNYSDRKTIMETVSRLNNDTNIFDKIHIVADPLDAYINSVIRELKTP